MTINESGLYGLGENSMNRLYPGISGEKKRQEQHFSGISGEKITEKNFSLQSKGQKIRKIGQKAQNRGTRVRVKKEYFRGEKTHFETEKALQTDFRGENTLEVQTKGRKIFKENKIKGN